MRLIFERKGGGEKPETMIAYITLDSGAVVAKAEGETAHLALHRALGALTELYNEAVDTGIALGVLEVEDREGLLS